MDFMTIRSLLSIPQRKPCGNPFSMRCSNLSHQLLIPPNYLLDLPFMRTSHLSLVNTINIHLPGAKSVPQAPMHLRTLPGEGLGICSADGAFEPAGISKVSKECGEATAEISTQSSKCPGPWLYSELCDEPDYYRYASKPVIGRPLDNAHEFVQASPEGLLGDSGGDAGILGVGSRESHVWQVEDRLTGITIAKHEVMPGHVRSQRHVRFRW
ncbi:hypothetical protein BKA82DRAFT_2188931 [Pisolithus tinctorius]|nr:hypothetical protein BKA82DRAFT_822498 [Pisolithus tinctorius]KAI6146659.1 hypothetical protein BKA82DRAFT_2188931 [Pisolithus tinctorius]